MTWTLIAHTSAFSAGADPVTTAPIDTTGADLFVICVVKQNATDTPTDSESNTWSPCGSTISNAFGDVTYAFYAESTITSASHTFSVRLDNTQFDVYAFSGSAVSPLDQYTGQLAAGSTFQPGSITPSEDNELIVTCLSGLWNAGPPVIDSGFTITESREYSLSPDIYYSIAQAHFAQTSAAAINPQWSGYTDGFGDIAGLIVSFKGTAGVDEREIEVDETIDNITPNETAKVLVQASLNDSVSNLSGTLQTKVIDNLNLSKTIDAITLAAQTKVIDNLSLNKTIDNLTLSSTSDIDVGISLNKLIGSPTEWSTLRKGSGITVSGSDNLTTTRATASAWHSIYSTTNHASGKFYIKFTSNTVDGIDGFMVGIGNNSGPTANYLGSDSNAIGLQSNGSSFGSSGGTNQGSWSSGDELLLAIDADNKKAYLRRNGSWVGSPSQGTGFISWAFSGPYYFGWSGFGGGGLDRTTASLSFDSDVELVGFKAWDDLTDFSSQVLVQTSLNTLISNLSTNLQSTVLVQTSLNQTLAPIILSGILSAVENLVLNKTIDEIDLNASSNVVVSLNLNKTIDAIVSSANATVILNINVNTNINNLTLSSTLQLVGEDRNLVLNALVDNLDLDSTVQVIVNAALNSLINSITSAADVDVIDNLSLNKTLDNLTLTATATQGGVSNIVVNATIDNVTSVATLTTVAVESNIVVDTTIDNLTLNARANRRSGTGDNVAWWWKQYVARHAQEKLLEREVIISIISPVGVLRGELVGVKEEVINVKVKIPDPIVFRGDFVSVTAQVEIKIICGVSGKGDVVGKNPKIKAGVSVGNEAQVNTPIILPAGVLNAKAKLINIINGNINSPEFSGYGFAESGYIVDSKIIGVMPLIIAKCEIGIVGEGRIINSNLIEINTNISHGINSSGKLVSEVGDITSEVNVGFEVEIKPITLSTIVIDAQISNGVIGEGKIIIDPRLNICVDKSNGNISNEISIVSPVGFIKKLNIIDGNYIKANIVPPLAIIMSDVIFGINNDIRINVPAGQVKGKAEVGIKLVLVENSNIITPLPFINAFAEHDPDDEDSLTTVLLLAA